MGKTTNSCLRSPTCAVSGQRDEALRELMSTCAIFICRESRHGATPVDAHFQELAELVKGLAVMGELTPRATDAISSFGERFRA